MAVAMRLAMVAALVPIVVVLNDVGASETETADGNPNGSCDASGNGS